MHVPDGRATLHCTRDTLRGPASSTQCARGLRPALGVGDRRCVWATALFSGRASRAYRLSRCQKKSTSAFRHTPLACSLTLVLRKTVVRWKSKYFAWASRRNPDHSIAAHVLTLLFSFNDVPPYHPRRLVALGCKVRPGFRLVECHCEFIGLIPICFPEIVLAKDMGHDHVGYV